MADFETARTWPNLWNLSISPKGFNFSMSISSDKRSIAEDFIDSTHGLVSYKGLSIWKNRRFGFITDLIYDFRLRSRSGTAEHVRSIHKDVCDVLVIGLRSAKYPEHIDAVFNQMSSSRHRVVFAAGEIGNRGKLENTNLVLSRYDLKRFDYVIAVDDDILLPANFLDLFLALSAAADLKIAMPAHRFSSYSGYEVTRRKWRTLARETHYVEVGPLVMFHRDTFDDVFPLPELRYGWGIDLHWPLLASRRGWKMGVIDYTSLKHTRPIGVSYSRDEARLEAVEYLARAGHLSREETFRTVAIPPFTRLG